jgi:hypothetical protein
LEEKKPTAAEDARRVLVEERDRRLKECQHEINELLRRYRCDLVGEPYITQNGRIAARVRLVDVPSQ